MALRHNLKMIGFGKAVAGMAGAAVRILADHVVAGHAHILVPVGMLDAVTSTRPATLPPADSPIVFHECAANNMPDAAAVAATKRVLETADSCVAVRGRA